MWHIIDAHILSSLERKKTAVNLMQLRKDQKRNICNYLASSVLKRMTMLFFFSLQRILIYDFQMEKATHYT